MGIIESSQEGAKRSKASRSMNETKLSHNSSTQLKGRVAIFFWEGYLSVAPSLINAIRLLVAEGYDVDIITRCTASGEFAPMPTFPARVRILQDGFRSELPSGTGFSAFKDECRRVRPRKYMPKRVRAWLHRAYERIDPWWELIHFALFSLRSVQGEKYKCFIGIDMHGLVAASFACLLKNAPIIYWSLEIRFLSDFKSRMERFVKRLERRCHRQAAFLIIQDLERAASLIRENQIRNAKTVIVPNSPLGWPQSETNDFFQKRFSLAPSRRIVLQLGMIDPAVLSLEIASEASKWNEDMVLIFHERARRAPADPYIIQVQQAGCGKVLLSLEPVPYDALDCVVMSGHIGLVFYRKELGPNFSEIAGASGKLAHYLRCGLPVICLDLPGLVKVVNQYRCGICVSEPGEIQAATEAIFRDYEFYRMNALKCYEELYEFGRYFREVLRKIEGFGQSENGSYLHGTN
jgi:glycosyltransferase involved in cell wall biosynthesis